MHLPKSLPAALALSCLLTSAASRAQEPVTTGPFPSSIIQLDDAASPQTRRLVGPATDIALPRTRPDTHIFAATAIGASAPTETLRLRFKESTQLSKIDLKGKDFSIEKGGTCQVGETFFKGESCTLSVRFTPQGPGRRSGSISIAHTSDATPAFVGLNGNGYAPVISFTPSVITTVPGTLVNSVGSIVSSTNLTVDGGDTLYIPDTGHDLIKEIDSSGTIATISPYFATPQTLAVDSSGFIYSTNVSGSTYYFSLYTPYGSQSAYGTSVSSSSCTPSAPCSLTSVGLSRPANISIDPYDNLFMEDGRQGGVEMPVANIAGGSGSFNLWYLTNQYVYTSGTPTAFAVSGSDNLYNFYNYGNTTCYLQEESVYQAEYSPAAKRVAGGTACGFSGDGGQARTAEISKTVGQITFDVAGNLYFSDAGNQRIRRIDSSTGLISTIAGNGTSGYTGDGGAATAATISNPTGVAVDSQGQVYILSSSPAGGTRQVIRKVGTQGYWNYGGVPNGTTSATKVFQVANTGNSTMTLSSNAFFTGSAAADYSLDPVATSCVLTGGASLAAGASCNIGIRFTPGAVGVRTASLVLVDNTVNQSNTISLLGAGTLPSATVAITAPGASVPVNTNQFFTVSVTSSSSTKPTGTVIFKINGTQVGGAVSVSSSGTASVVFKETTTGNYTFTATYSGDANYAPATVTKVVAVTAASSTKAASTVILAPAKQPSPSGTWSFAVRVLSSSGTNPTGTVHLLSGGKDLGTVTLNSGVAKLTMTTPPAGNYTFTSTYDGDTVHAASISAPETVTVPSKK